MTNSEISHKDWSLAAIYLWLVQHIPRLLLQDIVRRAKGAF
jgi:hypothetical protein